MLRWAMRDLAVLFLHLLATVGRLAVPGGTRAVVAPSDRANIRGPISSLSWKANTTSGQKSRARVR